MQLFKVFNIFDTKVVRETMLDLLTFSKKRIFNVNNH